MHTVLKWSWCFVMQNIDSLEHEAGVPHQAVVAAHGNFDSKFCLAVQASCSLMVA